RRTLEKEGFRVRLASGGEEGLELARELHPDAITLDVMMPGLDGWAVLSTLKGDPDLASIPVVMLTMLDDKNLGYSLGASDYLTKPIARAELVGVLEKYRRAGGTALVVEDDEATRGLVRQSLREEGWNVVEARNGREGLERVGESVPDVVVLDLMMPEVDGFTFASELRRSERGRDVPIVVMTAKDLTPEDRQRLSGLVRSVIQKGDLGRESFLAQIRDELRRLLHSRAATG